MVIRETVAETSEVKESGSPAGGEDSGAKAKANPKTTKPKSTKPKTTKVAKSAKKPKKDTDGTDDSSEKPQRQRIPRQSNTADKPPRQSRVPKSSNETRPDKPRDSKMRDVADSILAHRRVDATPEDPNANKPDWLVQKEALKRKFPDGWSPIKRLSPDALAGIRALNAQFPDTYNVPNLAAHFRVSPENIRRILRSKWTPSQDEEEDRERRWHNRGKSIWEAKAAMGIKPPKKWRDLGITRDSGYHERRKYGQQKEKEIDEQEKEAYQDWRAQFNTRRGGAA